MEKEKGWMRCWMKFMGLWEPWKGWKTRGFQGCSWWNSRKYSIMMNARWKAGEGCKGGKNREGLVRVPRTWKNGDRFWKKGWESKILSVLIAFWTNTSALFVQVRKAKMKVALSQRLFEKGSVSYLIMSFAAMLPCCIRSSSWRTRKWRKICRIADINIMLPE